MELKEISIVVFPEDEPTVSINADHFKFVYTKTDDPTWIHGFQCNHPEDSQEYKRLRELLIKISEPLIEIDKLHK